MFGLYLGKLGRTSAIRITAPAPTLPGDLPATALAIDGTAVLIDGLHILIA